MYDNFVQCFRREARDGTKFQGKDVQSFQTGSSKIADKERGDNGLSITLVFKVL